MDQDNNNHNDSNRLHPPDIHPNLGPQLWLNSSGDFDDDNNNNNNNNSTRPQMPSRTRETATSERNASEVRDATLNNIFRFDSIQRETLLPNNNGQPLNQNFSLTFQPQQQTNALNGIDINTVNTNLMNGVNVQIDQLNRLLPNLPEEERKQIHEFKLIVGKKIQEFLVVIEKRRKKILNEIELDNLKLKELRIDNSPQAISYLHKLQRMRLRALETENMEIRNLRLKILTIIEEYKKSLYAYCHSKLRGQQVENPTDNFIIWINSIDTTESSDLKEGLQDLSRYSRQFINNVLSNPSNQNISTSVTRRSPVFALNMLPSEILHLILDKLNQKYDIVKFLTVSKLWAEIIVKILYYRPHINKKSQLDLFLRTMKLTSEETVFNYRLMIKRLNFSFVGDYMHDTELNYFVGCKNLERLTLVFCKHITSVPISAVLRGCKFLQSVDITGIRDVSDDVFDTLATYCPRVQGFYVPQARNVTFDSLRNFIVHSPMLKRIKITANNNMNDELVELLANKCPLLVEVDITLSPNVTDSSLLKLLTRLVQLREFRITHNTNIKDNLFQELSKVVDDMPSLRLIDLSGCENITDKTIERIVNLAPKLRNVFLGKCSRITDASLFQLSKLGKNLQTVHFGHCFNITANGVRALFHSCTRIQYVDFACCTNLTNRTLYELADLPKLKRIGLVKCTQMTDEGLLNMVSLRGRNDTLERVHLSYCSNLTIYPIYELLMSCPRLSHLSLTAVPSFLRPDITMYCRPAPSDFSENQRQIFCVFSGKGVHKLRHYLVNLTSPAFGPHADVNDVLTKYIRSKNLIFNGETLEDALRRIITDLNQDSAAIIAATGLNQINGLNNDFLFQNINFERIDEVFSWYLNTFDGIRMSSEEVNSLLLQVNKTFCEDPFSDVDDDQDYVVAPGVNREINSEMCHIVRKFHELNDHIDDFEVNVASLVRVQFQFTGFLLHEMTQTYMQMIELNRQICLVQKTVQESGNIDYQKGLLIWRLLFIDKFIMVVQKYKLSTVVLRLYLKDNITLLTRQRELLIAHQRSAWNNNNDNDANRNANNIVNIVSDAGANDTSNNETNSGNDDNETENPNFWRQFGNRMQISPDQMRNLQMGLRTQNMVRNNNNNTINESMPETAIDSQMDEASGTPDEDML